MARDSAGLGIVDLDGGLRAKLEFLDIEEARRGVSPVLRSSVGNSLHVVGSSVNDGKNQHGISHLPMEPLRFVQRQPSDLRSDEP